MEIVFDNTNKIFPHEDKEIVISRAISKKGNSQYRINGKKHTRTEILDLLASAKINPEGYNIILQGDINRFVDMAPLERRKIIEGISDISIYEEKAIIDNTTRILQEFTEKIHGFRAPYFKLSTNTLKLLADAGYIYDSSLMADDHPYILKIHA